MEVLIFILVMLVISLSRPVSGIKLDIDWWSVAPVCFGVVGGFMILRVVPWAILTLDRAAGKLAEFRARHRKS